MSLQYSILVTVSADASIADLPNRLVEAFTSAGRSVGGVTAVAVEQITPGDTLQEPTTP